MQDPSFHIFTVGWDLQLIEALTNAIQSQTGIRFSHGLVGDAGKLHSARRQLPGVDVVALSKSRLEVLPAPDYALLAKLEGPGMPTIGSMVQGDRVLRHRDESIALGYATLLARRMTEALQERKPDLVLGSFDSLHAGLSLAVARSLRIPWVAMAFTTIPADLTGFCKGLTPETLLPLSRRVDATLLAQAREIAQSVRSKRQAVLAYQPPASLGQRVRQLLAYGRSLARRLLQSTSLGYDPLSFPTVAERVSDIVRRSINRSRTPAARMLREPPAAPFAFLPLHMSPESSIDTWAPFCRNQLALAVTLSQALPLDLQLVVKLHFSDPDNYSRKELLRLMAFPRVRIAHPSASSHAFLREARLVIGIQGTACLEAALLGKPVLIFGDSPYQHFPRTERAQRFDELNSQIRRLLALGAPTEEEIAVAYAAYLARYMPGRVNDWSRPIEPPELDRLAACFRALIAYVGDPAVRSRWYDEPPFAGARLVAGRGAVADAAT